MSEDVSTKFKEWQCPPAAVPETRRLRWIDEQCEEGLAWQRTQRGYGDWKKSFNVLAGMPDAALVPTYRSQLVTGRLKRNIKEVIGACANISPIWAYNSNNAAFQQNCTMMNNVTRAIYLEQFLDQGIKQTLQWAAATCTGWLRPVYRRDMYGTGKGNLNFLSYGSASVLPCQLPSNGNWQEAYAVTLLDEVPIAMAHGMFPDYQEVLHPTKSQFWHSNEIRTASKGNLFQRMWNSWGRKKSNSLTNLYVPLRYTYVIDLTVNQTGDPIKVGPWTVNGQGQAVPATSWGYEVPSLGSDIPVGNDAHGRVTVRKADENDARMYPNRRLLISSDNVLMYDGPGFDWHGELPLIPFCLDDWAWEPLGFSPMRDGYNIQCATDEIDRGTMDKVRAGLDMALAYDFNSVTKNEAEMFDPMQPRARIGFDGTSVDQPFKQVVPDSVLKIDPGSLEFRKILETTGDYQLAINDITALAKARSLGGDADNVEKIAQADGPIVRDISRGVERGLSRTGGQVKFLILQYYTSRRMMEYVGPDNVSPVTFDFDPESLVPSHLPDEFVTESTTQNGAITVSHKLPTGASVYSKMQRAKWFAGNLRYFILPHSAHEIAQMSYKLGLIQMRKSGIQIDSETIARAWGIDLGAPFVSSTPWNRFFEEQEAMAAMAVKMKMMVDVIQQAGVQPTDAMLATVAQLMGSGSAGREGRPPTGLQPPQIVSKDGGARSTISQSGS